MGEICDIMTDGNTTMVKNGARKRVSRCQGQGMVGNFKQRGWGRPCGLDQCQIYVYIENHLARF